MVDSSNRRFGGIHLAAGQTPILQQARTRQRFSHLTIQQINPSTHCRKTSKGNPAIVLI
jgi:hypothetical protein